MTAVLVIIIVVLAAAVVWLYVSLNSAQMEAAQATQMLQNEKQSELAAKQAQADAQENALENELKITWPGQGSRLCFENPYSVSWQAPKDMDAVTIYLYTPTTSTHIGDYPAVSGTSGDIGFGSFQWDLTNASHFVVPESQVYKMTISGQYHGHQISTSTAGVFSIQNCQ